MGLGLFHKNKSHDNQVVQETAKVNAEKTSASAYVSQSFLHKSQHQDPFVDSAQVQEAKESITAWAYCCGGRGGQVTSC